MAERASLSKTAAGYLQDGYPTVGDLEARYGDITIDKKTALYTASGDMKGARFSSAAHLAYQALIDIQTTLLPNDSTQTYTPDQEVTDEAFGDITDAIEFTNTQFKESIGKVLDTTAHPELAHVASMYLWMSEFDDIMLDSDDEDPQTNLQGPVDIPFGFFVTELLTHIIPDLWEETYPNTPLTLGKLFEIAFASSTGHILSNFASRHLTKFAPILFALTELDEDNDPVSLDTSPFVYDEVRGGITLKDGVVEDAEAHGREKVGERQMEELLAQAQGPELGCIMNASRRVFEPSGPPETLMMMYYHMLLANVQKSLYQAPTTSE